MKGETVKMNSPAAKPKPTPKLVLTAIISSSITLVSSLIYIALCTVALIYRYLCNTGDPASVAGSRFFLNTVYRAYLQDGACANTITQDGITGEYSVFVLVTITLSASVVSLVAAIILITAVTSDKEISFATYLSIIVYGYIGVYIASLAVDITFAAHFGMDYTFLTDILDNSSPGLSINYERDMIRIGAFVLMTLTLKGFIGHVINIAAIVMLVVYLLEYTQILDKHEHSIHKLGAINAYDSRRDRDPNQRESIQPPPRGPHMNHGYIEEEPPRSPMRENFRSDYPGNGFDRSTSWHMGPGSTGRPFSYLEESKPPAFPARPPASPSEPSWREPWRANAPPLPAPDYSPTPRRLKSALKPGYM